MQLTCLTILTSVLTLTAADIKPPYAVGTPPADAARGLVRVSDKEVRHYPGKGGTHYVVSYDNGATWESKPLPKSYPGATLLKKESSAIVSIPNSKEFFKIEPAYRGNNPNQGMFVSNGGLDGNWKKLTDADGKAILPKGILRTPIFVKNNSRWLIPGHGGGCYSYYSDDKGASWKRSNKVTAPAHRPGGVHQGSRWNHGMVGSSLLELKDGRVWMLARTAQDFFYESFSTDHGTTWSPAKPSRFHGNNVLGSLLRLKDGRILFVWNNCNSLPELPRAKGREDCFNNRDALHAAISEDEGKTWIGFREVALDHRRNEKDYAVFKGSNDRGVQQSELLQLDDNRVLLSVGQHPEHRKLMIMDVRWLYEKSRSDNFSKGTANWSTHQYFSKVVGHLGYNRTPGPLVVDIDGKKALHLTRTNDDKILNNNQGATWNFPTLQSGTLTTKVKLAKNSGGVRICLLDHWLNPTDHTVDQFSQFTIKVDANGKLPNGKQILTLDSWNTLTFTWTPKGCQLKSSSGTELTLPLIKPTPNGINYIHFYNTATKPDTNGCYVDSVSVKAK